MEQAIRDAWLEREVSHEMTGIIMGSGGPSTRDRGGGHAYLGQRGSLRGAKGDVVDGIATLATSSRSGRTIDRRPTRDLNHASAAPPRSSSSASRDDFCRWRRELDWTPVLFDAMGAMSSKFNQGQGLAPMTPMRRIRDRGRCAACLAEGQAYQGARSTHLCRVAGWRHIRRHDIMAPSGRRGALHEDGAQGREALSTHQSARDLDPDRRPQGDPRRSAGLAPIARRSATSLTGHSLAPPARRSDLFDLDDEQRLHLRSANIEILDPAADMPIARERRGNVALGDAVELVRLQGPTRRFVQATGRMMKRNQGSDIRIRETDLRFLIPDTDLDHWKPDMTGLMKGKRG